MATNVFLRLQSTRNLHLAGLPPAMYTPVAEVLQASRSSGSAARLLYLPFEDESGDVLFLDLLFIPLETPEIDHPHVLVMASPARPAQSEISGPPRLLPEIIDRDVLSHAAQRVSPPTSKRRSSIWSSATNVCRSPSTT